MITLRLALALLLLVPLAAVAQEQAAPAEPETAAEETTPATGSLYQPDFCEFSITFPEAPYSTRRCDENNPDRCYDQTSYTKVFEDLSSTVNFRVICNPIDSKIYDQYSGQVMEATLRAMTDRSVVQTFDTTFREESGFKQAGLVGEGQSGRTPTIYIAQLWIGKASAFSVEAELIGEAGEGAEILFRDILRSAHFAPQQPPKSPPSAQKDKPEQ